MTTRTTVALDGPTGSPRTDRTSTPTRGQRVTRWFVEPSWLHVALAAILAVAVIGLLVWRSVSVQNLEADVRATRAQAREAMTVQAAELLQLTAIPMAWAIRSAVATNDLRDVDMYMDKLVHEDHVRRVVFVDGTGTIVASTNAKLEDQPAAVAMPGIDMVAAEPRVDRAGDDLRIVVPVMSYERQVGTLVLEYSLARSIDRKLVP
jgi:hypothetical protein